MVRKILGVVAGFAAWSVIWVGSGVALQAAMPQTFQSDGRVTSAAALIGLLALSVICSFLSGMISMAITKNGRGPAIVLGVLLLAVGVFVQSQYWDKMPIWYHLSFLALLIPATLVGAGARSGRQATMRASFNPA